MDWLFEKYDNDDLIVIHSNDEDEEDDTLAGFMPSPLTSDMDSFLDILASLM